ASGSSLEASLVPRWAEVGGRGELLKRIDDPQVRPRLLAEMQDNLRRRGGADSLLIIDARDRQLIGKRLNVIAAERKQSPVEAALEINRTTRGAGAASSDMIEEDTERFMKEKRVITGADDATGHPSIYGMLNRTLQR